MSIPDDFGDNASPAEDSWPSTQRGGPIVLRDRRSIVQYDDADVYDDEPFDERQRMQLAAIWGAILKHKWTILGIIIVALAAGFGATMLMKRLYTAHTTLQIDRAAAQVVQVEGLSPTEALTGNEFMDTQIGLLKSEALARRVVQTQGLADNDVARAMVGLPPVAKRATVPDPANIEDKIAGAIMRNTAVKQQGLSRLVTVEFTSPSPSFSARIANSLAENFQAASLERRFESSSYARKFLEERIAQVKQKLEESEKQLVDYGAKQQIINVSPGASSDNPAADTAAQSLTAANLSALNSTLTIAQSDRIKAEQRWRQIQSVPILSTPEALGDPTIQSLLQQRATLSSNYQQQLKIYAPQMPEMQQLKAQLDEVDRQLAAAGESIRTSVRSKYEIALAQERSLASKVEGLKGSFLDLRERNIENTILQREVDTNRTLYDGLLQRYKEVGVAGGVDTNNIAVVDRAQPPGGPSSPKLGLNLAISLILGLAMAGGVTMLLELLDESIRTPDDIASKLGLTVLGAIPVLDKGTSPAAAIADPRSAFSEAYSSARTALQFVTPEGVPQNILVTSARPSEGKSTTSLALARSFANLGANVLLIDADLRNPSLHRLVGLENNRGLSNYLTGMEWSQVARKTDHKGLSVIPSGPLPPNPAELLAGERLPYLLRQARAHFDLIILDGPPVIGLADAPLLSSRTAATVIVIESGAAKRSVVRIALSRLRLARAKVVGALLTKFDSHSAGYGYGYGYGYAYAYDYGSKRIGQDAG